MSAGSRRPDAGDVQRVVERAVRRANEAGVAPDRKAFVSRIAVALGLRDRRVAEAVAQLLRAGRILEDGARGRGLRHRDLSDTIAEALMHEALMHEDAGDPPASGSQEPGPKPAHDGEVIFANREPSEWVRVSRRGRSRGFDVHVDARTLQLAGVPIDAPAERVRVRRSAAGRGRIVLEVRVDGGEAGPPG